MRLPLALLLLLLVAPALAQQGRVRVQFVPARTELGRAFEKAFRDNEGLRSLESLDDLFYLPNDLPIVYCELGTVNAGYIPSKHCVVVGYELLAHFLDVFREVTQDPREQGQMMAGAMLFTIFHELGHALIGELDLPTTGKEEDAVDEFSALVLSQNESGQISALAAAHWFQLEARRAQRLPYFDEHSLSEQRFQAVLGILYGANPERFRGLCQKLGMTAEQLERAQANYVKKRRSWNTLLRPYLKPGVSL